VAKLILRGPLCSNSPIYFVRAGIDTGHVFQLYEFTSFMKKGPYKATQFCKRFYCRSTTSPLKLWKTLHDAVSTPWVLLSFVAVTGHRARLVSVDPSGRLGYLEEEYVG